LYNTQQDRELNARSTVKERCTSSWRFSTLTSFCSQALESRCSTSCLKTSSSAKRLAATPASAARDRSVEISSMNSCMSSCKTEVCCFCCTVYCCICVLPSQDAHPAREVNSSVCSLTLLKPFQARTQADQASSHCCGKKMGQPLWAFNSSQIRFVTSKTLSI